MVEQRLFVGIDWGNTTHAVCVVDAAGHVLDERVVAHDLEGFDVLMASLRKLRGVATVALERSGGLLVDELLRRGVAVFHLNPLQTDRLRQARNVAGAKDDRTDAATLAQWLRLDEAIFLPVAPMPAAVQMLKQGARTHTTIGRDILAHVARAREFLASYYPNFLRVSTDLESDWVRALWKLAPNPDAARRLKRTKLAPLLARVERLSPDDVLDLLRKPALVAEPGVAAAAEQQVAYAIAMLDAAIPHHRAADRALRDQALELAAGAAPPRSPGEPPSWAEVVSAVLSMPGVAGKIGATLIGEAAEALRSGSYSRARMLAGVAPVTEASGKRSGPRARVTMRRSCNEHLRNVVHFWGEQAARRSPYWRERRAEMLARGHTPARANRHLVDRLLRVLFALLRSGRTYDETLLTKGAPM
jgi:hypothetical protein